MRLRPDPASRFEHVASIAAATAITVGSALLVLAPVRPRVAGESAPAPVRDAEQVSEHLVYVIARAPTSTVAPAPPPAHPLSRVEPRYIARSPAREQMSDGHGGSVASASEAVTPAAITPLVVPGTGSGWAPRPVSPLLWPDATATSEMTTGIASWWGTVGHAPAWGVAQGFLRRHPEPMRFDSALRVGYSLAAKLTAERLKSLPLTQTERDVQLRAEALAVIAARGTGMLNPRAISAGVSIPFPLPFGGPSHEQRERDRIIYARTKEIQARIQRRVDSTVAARRQRHADSLASVDDSSRYSTRPQY